MASPRNTLECLTSTRVSFQDIHMPLAWIKARGLRCGVQVRVRLQQSTDHDREGEFAILRVMPYGQSDSYSESEWSNLGSSELPCLLPNWLGDVWGLPSLDQAADRKPDIARHVAVIEAFDRTVEATVASRIVVSKVGETPWVPTSLGLRRMRATGEKSPMDFMDFEAAIARGLDGSVVDKGVLFGLPLLGRIGTFRICAVESHMAAGVNTRALFRAFLDSTQVEIGTPIIQSLRPQPIFGGYKEEVDELTRLIESAFYHGEAYERLRILPVRAVLVTGPSGVGKSVIIDHILNFVLAVPSFHLMVSEITDAERAAEKDGMSLPDIITPLLKCIEKAKLTAPSVVVIDGMELLDEDFKTPRFDRLAVASQIASEIGRLDPSWGICVVASAIDATKLPPVLTRTTNGGFDRIVEINVPAREQRENIARGYLRGIPLTEDVNVPTLAGQSLVDSYAFKISQQTAGFVGQNLYLLISRAVRHAVCRVPNVNNPPFLEDDANLTERLASLSIHGISLERSEAVPERSFHVKWSDFSYALSMTGPSQVGFESRKPNVPWESVGGYEELKRRLQQLASWPLDRPEAYERLGVRPPSGILLYGPSGCGKTLLVHALAASSHMNFISVKGSEIYSKYLGESEAMVRKLFASARRLAPCLLFMDEMDAIGTRREWSDEGGTGVNERVLSTLLNEMDGVQERKGVLIVACTSRPDLIDDALLRPGRLDHHLYVQPPTEQDRLSILKCVTGAPSATTMDKDVDLEKLTDLTEGFTGADLTMLIRESGIQALRENPDATQISWRHMQSALAGAIHRDEIADPFTAALFAEDDDEGKGTNDEGPSDKRRAWWRPAWIDSEDLRRYERFRNGRNG